MTDNESICNVNATLGYSDVGVKNIDGHGYEQVFYKYTYCPNLSSTQHFMCPKRRLFACFCSWNPFDAAFYFDTFLCNVNEIKALAFAQISVATLAIILNLTVLSIYYQRQKIRNKVGNILLMSQALFDLISTTLCTIPTVLMILVLPGIYHHMSKDDETSFKLASGNLSSFSINISLYAFTLIAIERYVFFKELYFSSSKISCLKFGLHLV